MSKSGEIGLPDIQRPFVWKNAKVRHLFDSMYKGYPVGYFLFWQNGFEKSGDRQIRTEDKQKPPRLVIVDGQQRLTSLYAVVNNIPVVRNNVETEKIQIAFNPLEERFEVIDAAVARDPLYLPDISILWNKEHGLIKIVRGYLERLESTREISSDENRKIEKSVSKLQGLMSFHLLPLSLLQIFQKKMSLMCSLGSIAREHHLIEQNFILTLMSVFWDEGRAELEEFAVHPELLQQTQLLLLITLFDQVPTNFCEFLLVLHLSVQDLNMYIQFYVERI